MEEGIWDRVGQPICAVEPSENALNGYKAIITNGRIINSWFSSYLSERSQSTQIGSSVSIRKKRINVKRNSWQIHMSSKGEGDPQKKDGMGVGGMVFSRFQTPERSLHLTLL